MNRTITIHHLEDEPATMEWLPGALLNHYWDRHPEFVADNCDVMPDKDGNAVSFTVKPPSGAVIIRYRVYRNKDEFDRHFEPKPGDVVLLDMMQLGPKGELVLEGPTAYKKAHELVSTKRIYLITAYPRSVPPELGARLGPRHIITKPPDAARLCADLLTTLELWEDDDGTATAE